MKVTADVVGADDKATQTSYTGNYDGKDYPLTGSSTGADTVSLKTHRCQDDAAHR